MGKILSKVPEVTLAFWIIKILATTLGETGGDAVTMSVNLGYAVGSVIFMAFFLAAVTAQIAYPHYNRFRYWTVIVATTTAGTTLADYFDRSLGIGYIGGSLVLFAMVIAVIMAWRATLGSASIHKIRSRKGEIFYWATILTSNTLGTALGDYFADSSGFGYVGSAAIFAAAIAVLALVYFTTGLSRTFLFWAAFILTRPLGATLGDFLTKTHEQGGLDLSRFSSSGIIAALIVAGIAMTPKQTARPVNKR